MQPETIAQIIEDLSLLHEVTVEELEGVVKQYPYFAMGHVLLLKKYQLVDGQQFDRYLPMAAIHVADRKRLHAFVEATIPEPVPVEPTEESDSQTTEAKTAADELMAYLADKPSPATDNPPSSVAAPAAETADEESTGEEAESLVDETTAPAEVPVEEESPAADTEPVSQAEPTDTATTAGPPIDAEKHTFGEWLQRFAGTPKAETTPAQADTQQKEANLPTDPAAAGEAFMARQLQSDTPHDKLITGNNPVDSEEIEAVEGQAKKSVEMGDALVTETLAKIFTAQGNRAKAIETYEKLRLKYPEKSDYFAAQIEKLQENQS